MKKTAAVIITAVLVLTLGSTTVFAVGSGRAQNSQTAPSAGNSAKHCPNYTDENSDGICDYYSEKSTDSDTGAVCPNYNLTCTGTIRRHASAGNNRNSSGFPGHHGSSCEYHTDITHGEGCGYRAGCGH